MDRIQTVKIGLSLLLANCVIALTTNAWANDAEIFKCVENGIAKFSAYPCKDPSKQQAYDVTRSESMTSYFERQQKKLQQKLDERRERAEKYIAGYPALPKNIREAILDCKVIRGMTRKQVYTSWSVMPESHRKVVKSSSSLTYYTYRQSPICMNEKFRVADLTFDNRTNLLVGWNIQY